MNHLDRIFYINLERRPERNYHFIQQCIKHYLPEDKIQRFSAIDASKHTFTNDELAMFSRADYITKPFDLEELLLRISNLIKRTQKDNSTIFSFGSCEINFKTYEVKDINGNYLTLSRREIGLLDLLTKKINYVVSRDQIIEKLWNVNENPSSRTIDNYILNFRKIFEPNPKNPKHFISIRGVGYKFIL